MCDVHITLQVAICFFLLCKVLKGVSFYLFLAADSLVSHNRQNDFQIMSALYTHEWLI